MFNYDDFLTRAKARLLTEPPLAWNRSDDDMNECARLIPEGIIPKPAAVLIGIVKRAEPMVILTKRQDHMRKHAGQIAFAGGRLDAGETVLDAALREAEEEIALDRKFVTPLGYADGFLTITQFQVVPVVAVVSPLCILEPHAGEVAEIFEVPLAFLMDGQNCKLETRTIKNITRQFYAYTSEDRFIWGATAGMIKNLHDRLYE